MGLPDLYDTDYSGAGCGRWAIMAGGSWGGDGASTWSPVHMTAWSKIDLGWITPTVVDANEDLPVNQVETNAQVYKLWTDGNPTDEYFLIENRQLTGFDSYLYNSGLLIYHIDENIIAATRPSNEVNNGSIYGVAIEEADGDNDLFNGTNRGDANDPFPGATNNTAFDSTGTSPNSMSNAGDNTHVGVNDISASSGSMSAHFYINGNQELEAEFSGDPTTGEAPLTVEFTDESTGSPTSWEWDFGDSETSTDQNPTHEYADTGSYDVRLVISDGVDVDTMLKEDYITVTEGGGSLAAEFSGTPTSGAAPLSVAFTDESTGAPTSWDWDFGDFRTSTAQNPTHVYDTEGQYTVRLIISDGVETDTMIKTDYIDVGGSSGPTAAFSATPTSGAAPLTVNFSDESTGAPTGWLWDFGDNNTSTTQNPVHQYTAEVSYDVRLIRLMQTVPIPCSGQDTSMWDRRPSRRPLISRAIPLPVPHLLLLHLPMLRPGPPRPGTGISATITAPLPRTRIMNIRQRELMMSDWLWLMPTVQIPLPGMGI
jgi:PKD repeat protein